MSLDSGHIKETAAARAFVTTHWSVVMSAGNSAASEREDALEQLCRTYWYPIYSFIRRRGYDAYQAQDLTQSFFERFLEPNDVSTADASKGRFRTFLLACVKNFLANEWDRQNAVKRGGRARFVSLDEVTAEQRYQAELICDRTPEEVFQQRWVETVLETTLRRLNEEFAKAGKSDQFDSLKVYLIEDRGEPRRTDESRR